MKKLKEFIKKNPAFAVFLILALLLVCNICPVDRHPRSL